MRTEKDCPKYIYIKICISLSKLIEFQIKKNI